MIRQLIAALAEADVEVDAEAIANALWLARIRRSQPGGADRQQVPVIPPMPTEPRPPDAEPRHPVDRAGPATARANAIGPATAAGPTTASKVSSVSDTTATSVMLGRARALPGALELSRTLRPLKRRHPSKRDHTVDTEATVDYFCDTGVLIPVMQPGAEPWFDVDVLVDVGPSMEVWQDTARELVSLLQRHGAFREVRHWTLEQADDKIRLSHAVGVRSEATQLVDPDARRLTVLVTDCIGPLWYEAPIWHAIRGWGLFAPVVLVTMLPSRLWPQTALGSVEVTMRSHQPGSANRLLDAALPWWWPDDNPPRAAMPLPVITLEAAPVAEWARMVMGAGGVEVPGVLATPPLGRTATRADDTPLDAEERVRRFRVTVSPVAYRLAMYLSAALRGRWRLDLARVVQQALLPDSSQVHLAEVIVGGLVRRADPHAGLYEFTEGVADVLRRSLTGTEALRVLQVLGDYIERETGHSPGIAARLLGEPAPADITEHFRDVRAGVDSLIREMGLARADVTPSPATGAPGFEAPGSGAEFGPHGAAVSALVALPGGRLATGAEDGQLLLWDPTRTPPFGQELGRHSAAVTALIALPDGRLASAAQDGQLLLWDPAVTATATAGFPPAAELGRHSAAVTALIALPDGRLASAAQDGQLLLWDPAVTATATAGFPPAAELGRHSAAVTALIALPDGRLASAAQDGQLLLWDPAVTATATAGFPPAAELGRHSAAVTALIALPDGRLASAAQDGQLLLWDPAVTATATAGFPPAAELGRHSAAVTALIALPDGRLASAAQDGQLLLWDPAVTATATAGFPPAAELGRHSAAVTALIALPDGRLASAAQDGQLLLWDPAVTATATAGFPPAAELGRHSAAVTALIALPDGRLASAAQDGQLLLWDPASIGRGLGETERKDAPSSEERPAPSERYLMAYLPPRASLSSEVSLVVEVVGVPPDPATASVRLADLEVGDDGTFVTVAVQPPPGLIPIGTLSRAIRVPTVGDSAQALFLFRAQGSGRRPVLITASASGTYLAQLSLDLTVEDSQDPGATAAGTRRVGGSARTARIVAVHGTGQQMRGPETLRTSWLPPLLDGLALAGGQEVASEDLAIAFYGDLFRPSGEATPRPDEEAFDQDLDEELLIPLWQAAAGQGDIPEAESASGAGSQGLAQRALRALNSSRFFSGISARMMVGDLRQVRSYLEEPTIRRAAQDRVAALVGPGTRVVVAHSIGSIVAYEALCAHPKWDIRMFVTLGSPLGWRYVFDRLNPPPQDGIGSWPGSTRQWTNIADSDDIVALEKRLAAKFAGPVRDILVDNGAQVHDVGRYLSAAETGRAIAAGLADSASDVDAMPRLEDGAHEPPAEQLLRISPPAADA